eukprot:237946-Pelagomonas_calceolata.AAC.2
MRGTAPDVIHVQCHQSPSQACVQKSYVVHANIYASHICAFPPDNRTDMGKANVSDSVFLPCMYFSPGQQSNVGKADIMSDSDAYTTCPYPPCGVLAPQVWESMCFRTFEACAVALQSDLEYMYPCFLGIYFLST